MNIENLNGNGKQSVINDTDDPKLTLYRYRESREVLIKMTEQRVSAGFPSPALDFEETTIDLNKYLIIHPMSTFIVRVQGNSMIGEGIADNDLLIIDKSLKPTNDKICVCFLDGQFLLKKIKVENGECWLMPANVQYKPIKVSSLSNFTIWGTVLHCIKSF